MKLSVIIPTLNEEAVVACAVESAWQAGAQEVLVADGESTDQTRPTAERAGARVLLAPRGRGSQQNAGARAATGDVLLFLHADNRLAPQSREQLQRAFARPRILHVAFCQRIDAPQWKYRLLERGNAARVRWPGLPYGDQAIAVRAETFRQLGGFPAVPFMEDLLLMRHLRARDWPALLEGPVYISARRWQKHGVVAQTLRNWSLVAAYSLGAAPEQLAKFYRWHE